MSVRDQSLPKWTVRTTSVFPLIATEEQASHDVSNVPIAGSIGDQLATHDFTN